MKLQVAWLLTTFSFLVLAAPPVDAASSSWMSGPLYHEDVPSNKVASHCSNEKWTILTNPLYQYDSEAAFPVDVCVYRGRDFAYAHFSRPYTVSFGYGFRESGIAVAYGTMLEEKKMAPVYMNENSNFDVDMLPLGRSSNDFAYVKSATSFSYAKDGIYFINKFIDKLEFNDLKQAYMLADEGDPVTDADGRNVRPASYGVSVNGLWIAGVAVDYVFRLNTNTRNLEVVASKNYILASMSPKPRYELFISNSGSTMGYSGYGVESRVFLVNASCTSERWEITYHNDGALYSDCQSRDIGIEMDKYSPQSGLYSGGARDYSQFMFVDDDQAIQYADHRQIWHRLSHLPSHSLKYLALGDSFTSGEGNIDQYGIGHYLPGTDVAGDYSLQIPREMCHQSESSYPYLLGSDAGLYRGMGMASVACSGAVRSNIATNSLADRSLNNGFVGDRYLGQATDVTGVVSGYMPRLTGIARAGDLQTEALDKLLPGRVQQIEQLKMHQPLVATVQVSGNDLGFGPIIQACILNNLGSVGSVLGEGVVRDCDWSQGHFKQDIATRIRQNADELIALYSQMREASPHTTLYAIGYPLFAERSIVCSRVPSLSIVETEFIEQSIRYANDTIKAAASRAGIRYIDIENALSGGSMCESGANMTEPLDILFGAILTLKKQDKDMETVLDDKLVVNPIARAMVRGTYAAETSAIKANGMIGDGSLLGLLAVIQQFVHPNADGHRAIANTIRSALGDGSLLDAECDGVVVFCPDAASTAIPYPPSFFGTQTMTERVVEMSVSIIGKGVKAIGGMITDAVRRGDVINLQVPVSRSVINVHAILHSDTYNLGKLDLRDSGVYGGEVTIPADVPTGMHILEVVADLEGGGTYSNYMQLFVLGSEDDEDADGVLDIDDSIMFNAQAVTVDAAVDSGALDKSASVLVEDNLKFRECLSFHHQAFLDTRDYNESCNVSLMSVLNLRGQQGSLTFDELTPKSIAFPGSAVTSRSGTLMYRNPLSLNNKTDGISRDDIDLLIPTLIFFAAVLAILTLRYRMSS